MFKWLNGKKTIFGIFGVGVVHTLETLGKIPTGVADMLRTFFVTLTGIGAAHKIDKLTTATKTK